MKLTNFQQDRTWIENKYHNTNEPFDSFQRMAYHGHPCDPTSGMDDEEMLQGLRELFLTIQDRPHAFQKATGFAYVLDNARIDVSEHDYFVCFYNWNRHLYPTLVWPWYDEVKANLSPEDKTFMNENIEKGNIALWADFDHSVPDWDALFRLGFPGIIERANQYRRMHEETAPLTEMQAAFFDGIEIEYRAIVRLLDRLYQKASGQTHAKATRIATCLQHLRDGKPEDTFDVLQMIFLYFLLSESVDGYQVRSLGSGLDAAIYPYYMNDLKTGRYTKDELDEFIAYFLMQFAAIGNYWGHPFYLGGHNPDGSSRVTEASYAILDVYRELSICSPKLQIQYSSDMPIDFVNKTLDMVRSGYSNMVFINEKAGTNALLRLGISPEDAHNFDTKGCYEYAVRGKQVDTAPLYINPTNIINEIIDDATDTSWETFESFKAEYYRRLGRLFEDGMRVADELEKNLEFINPAPMFSGTIEHSLKKAEDAYFRGSAYNSTTILVTSIASAVDSLLSIKHMVYDAKLVTLPELKTIIDANWDGYEALRNTVRRLPCKYGNHHPEADALTTELCDFLFTIQGRPNVRGGKYSLHVHSALMFVWMGEKMRATPDGRLAGEETSKNASPSVGMDKNGATALMMSALATRPDHFTGGHCLDVMLHPTAVSGDSGLIAMKALLDTYEQNGGASIQFNIVDPKTLKQAQQTPEKYRNLQIRVCGWNVLFNDLPRVEQDAYIERAENII